MILRDYQRRTLDMLYEYLGSDTGNPCVVLPTGSGKSLIVAMFCKETLEQYPDANILMLTHQAELIEQNEDRLLKVWPSAPVGVYSASLGRRRIAPITFAGIQSVVRQADKLGHQDVVLVDECHAINHSETGNYRKLLAKLKERNPNIRIIGLSATPYRLGHGYIHEGTDTLFNDLIEPVSILELIEHGYLSPLRSKHTEYELSADGVKKVGGDYQSSALELAMDTDVNNAAVVEECIARAKDRKGWIVFCAGVKHAEHISIMLNDRGIISACVTGLTPAPERARILREYKEGKIQAVTNVSVLTTGFDAPHTDCIVFLRPTMSPGLYMQMAGRGMRIADGKQDCLVLDFAGCVREHGAITSVNPPRKKGEKGVGKAPTKTCLNCGEILAANTKQCTCCGAMQEVADKGKDPKVLHNDDIMGIKPSDMAIKLWTWRAHTSKASGQTMLKVSYYGDFHEPVVDEYLVVLNEGYAGKKARAELVNMATRGGVDVNTIDSATDIAEVAKLMQKAKMPERILYMREGKYYRIHGKHWSE